MQLERRALYNSLRMNWLKNPKMKVEPWQVEDYRSLSLEKLIGKLNELDVSLDRIGFVALAENAQTPEQMTDELLAGRDLEASRQDQVYLILFELWRRLVPEKLCLSIFCDELDHQIFNYDSAVGVDSEAIQDILANLAVVLDDNTDDGADPIEVFESISQGCANDVESFLYDFIQEQIDLKNDSYAAELLDDFYEYVKDPKWFDFSRLKIYEKQDPENADKIVHDLVDEAVKDQDLDFNFELLAWMTQGGDRDLFVRLVKQTVPLLEYEEDFQDLLSLCADYFRLLDHDEEEKAIQGILKKRAQKIVENEIQSKDPHIAELLKIVR